MSRFAIASGAALLLFGCANVPPPTPITPVAAPAPKAIPANVEAKPIQFRRIVVKMARGAPMGTLSAGYLCIPNSPITYKGGTFVINDEEFTDIFREELTKAKFPVVGDPSSLFEDPSELRAELIVAGLVTDMKTNVCVSVGSTYKGEAALTVEWQVFSRSERRVVHKVTTRGTGRVDEFTANGQNIVYHRAFSVATRALLADDGFHQLVTTGRPVNAPAAETVEASFTLQPRERVTGPIAARMPEIQSAVVTVISGRGHGSGFFISNDGYALTNAHVVGDAKSVKLKLASGREVDGDVVARNRKRDVALIQAKDTGFVALPLASGDIAVGNEVYAIGSPLTQQLAATVTRGIVSGHRTVNELRFLQSDVTVQQGNSGGPLTDASGNVVAMTVWGVAPRGTTIGLNFFIPIDEALRGINIDRTEAKTDRRDANQARMVAVNRPVAPPAPPTAAPASQPTQVASVTPPPPPPERPSLEGNYRASLPAETFAGVGILPLSITVHGSQISGYGTAASGRTWHCRLSGSMGGAGDALVRMECSGGGWNPLVLDFSGLFGPDPEESNAVIGRTRFQTAQGRSGEVVWRR